MAGQNTILPVTKVKRDFLEILKSMKEDYATITVTRNGEPVGIIMTPDRYEALLETIEILGNKKILQALNYSNQEFASGKVEFEISGYFSIRANRFRIIYKIDDKDQTIEIHYVGHRKDIYELFKEAVAKR